MTTHTPLISVIVPVYIHEAYVAPSIIALHAKSLDDVALSVVDDGSN